MQDVMAPEPKTGGDLHSAQRLGALCVDFGYCSRQQIEATLKRQAALKAAGLQLSLGQILRQQKLITAAQLKALLEYAERNAQSAKRQSGVNDAVVRKLGRYEIRQVLGEKDHARIYRAFDPQMKRMVQLKVLPRELARDSNWLQRYRREVEILNTVEHPNITACFGLETLESMPTIVLEFIDGMALSERLDREGNVTEQEAWQITAEVAKGLAFAHSRGVLHRDIKPSHIWCAADGRVKITDFVLGKSVYDDMGLTAQGTTVGTPFFISPEQARGTDDLDARTDLYSLGCATFQMLTGSVPFLGEGVGETMMKHLKDPRPDPRELLPEISPASSKLVKWMMAVDPAQRPQSADELLGQIARLLPTLNDTASSMRPMYKVTASDTPMPNVAAGVTADVQLLADPSEASARKGRGSASGASRGFFTRLFARLFGR